MKKIIFSGVVIFFGALAGAAQAATVQLIGDTVTYEYDTDTNAGALALYGAPEILGDVVRFLPPDFIAQSIDGVGQTTGTNTDVVSANFIFSSITSNNGDPIAQIQVTEFGDYGIVNGDSVGIDVFLTASNNNNFLEFTSATNSFASSTPTGPGDFPFQVDVGIMPALAFATNPNDIALTIQNTLTAVTNAAGEVAFIQKKLSLVATVVPVPAAIWMLMSALGILGFSRRGKA